MDEGEDLPQTSGILTKEALDAVNSHQLVAGKSYDCQRCGQSVVAPQIYRCFCGLRICRSCGIAHEAEG